MLSLERHPLDPPALRPGGGLEPGTDLPTAVDPELPAMRRRFSARHPDHSWTDFDRRAREIFVALQDAWSEGRWERARPHESDALFQVHRFWIERYRRFGLRNRVASVVVSRTELAKIALDAFYESVTLRIFASALDWTEDAEGRVVAGDRTRARTFSEYWTFLRTIGARRREDASAGSCPSCGGPLDSINMAGVCAYCGSKITTGEFDWVVSRIEQDDAYGG